MKPKEVPLFAANSSRARTAGARDAELALAAIEAIQASPPVIDEMGRRQTYLRVLRRRAMHPDLSLSELGDAGLMSKDAYAGMLRRAFTYAAEKAGGELVRSGRAVSMRYCPVCHRRTRPTRDKNIASHQDSARLDECPASGEPYYITFADIPDEVAS